MERTKYRWLQAGENVIVDMGEADLHEHRRDDGDGTKHSIGYIERRGAVTAQDEKGPNTGSKQNARFTLFYGDAGRGKLEFVEGHYAKAIVTDRRIAFIDASGMLRESLWFKYDTGAIDSDLGKKLVELISKFDSSGKDEDSITIVSQPFIVLKHIEGPSSDGTLVLTIVHNNMSAVVNISREEEGYHVSATNPRRFSIGKLDLKLHDKDICSNFKDLVTKALKE